MDWEKSLYRDSLELLNEKYPDKLMMNLEEVAAILGYKDSKTVRKRLGKHIINNRISKVVVARYMSAEVG